MLLRSPLLRRASVGVAALAVVVFLAGCGEDDGGNVIADGATGETSTTTTQPETVCPAMVPGDIEKPEVTVPEGEPPAELVTEDLRPGDGEVLRTGQEGCVHYVGVSASNGEQFDASWDRDTPFPFMLGEGQVIQGWEQGLEGMMVGGRRQLVIPPDLAYGEQGSPPAIAPNETLVFVIDLLAVGEPPPPDAPATTEAPGDSTTEPSEPSDTSEPSEPGESSTTAGESSDSPPATNGQPSGEEAPADGG